jgi:hypothetical protein
LKVKVGVKDVDDVEIEKEEEKAGDGMEEK